MENQKKVFMLVLILIMSGCAYFNVFYNAEKYYALGIAPLESNNKPNLQYLDKAIEKASKILEFHPGSKYVDDALLIIGKSYMYKGEYTKAIRKFNELNDYYPNSQYIDESIYFTALTYVMQEEYEIAKIYFKRLMDRKSDWTETSLIKMVDILLIQRNYERAIEIVNTYAEYMKNKAKLHFIKGLIKYEMQDYEGSFDEISRIKQNKLKEENRFRYVTIYANLLIKKEEYSEAEEIISRNLKYFNNPQEKHSLELIRVRILSKNGKIKDALNILDNILIQERNIPLKDSLLFERGIIYEQHMEDYEKAKENYKKIVDELKNSLIRPEAEIKIMSIELLNELAADTIKDIEKIAKNRFLYAEVNYISLKKIDEAIKYYTIIKDSYPESYYAPKALYALSYIYMKDLFDTTQSKLYLETIINDYSHSEIFLDAEKQIKRIEDENNTEKQ